MTARAGAAVAPARRLARDASPCSHWRRPGRAPRGRRPVAAGSCCWRRVASMSLFVVAAWYVVATARGGPSRGRRRRRRSRLVVLRRRDGGQREPRGCWSSRWCWLRSRSARPATRCGPGPDAPDHLTRTGAAPGAADQPEVGGRQGRAVRAHRPLPAGRHRTVVLLPGDDLLAAGRVGRRGRRRPDRHGRRRRLAGAGRLGRQPTRTSRSWSSRPAPGTTSRWTWGSIARTCPGRSRPSATASTWLIDLAEVNGRVFVNNAAMGVYATVVQSADYRDAKIQTMASMLPDLLGPTAQPSELHCTLPSGDDLVGRTAAAHLEQPVPPASSAGRRPEDPAGRRCAGGGVGDGLLGCRRRGADSTRAGRAGGPVRRLAGVDRADDRDPLHAARGGRRGRRGPGPRSAVAVRQPSGGADRPGRPYCDDPPGRAAHRPDSPIGRRSPPCSSSPSAVERTPDDRSRPRRGTLSPSDHTWPSGGELGRADRAVYRAVADFSTPVLDVPLRRISDFANHSKPWFVVAGALAVFGGHAGADRRADGVGAIGLTSSW